MIEERPHNNEMGFEQPSARLPQSWGIKAILWQLSSQLLAFPAVTTSCTIFIIYTLTLAPDLVHTPLSGDSGELITASYTWGIPHPTGYPTYTLLSKLFSFLPVGTIAFRYNLFSAVAAALAAGFVATTAQFQLSHSARANTRPPHHSNRLSRHNLWQQPAFAAITVGLLFASTPLVWEQATIAEVYSLNILLVATFVWAIITKKTPLASQSALRLSVDHTCDLTPTAAYPPLSPRQKWAAISIIQSPSRLPYGSYTAPAASLVCPFGKPCCLGHSDNHSRLVVACQRAALSPQYVCYFRDNARGTTLGVE